MNRGNRKSSKTAAKKTAKDLKRIRRRLREMIAREYYAYMSEQNHTTVTSTVIRDRVNKTSGETLKQLASVALQLLLSQETSRFMKHQVAPAGTLDADLEEQLILNGFDKFICRERLTWKEPGTQRVLYRDPYEGLEAERELWLEYKRTCMSEDQQSYRRGSAWHDNLKPLVKLYGDLPPRELLLKYMEDKKQAGTA